MHRKKVLFVQDGLQPVERVSRVVAGLDAEFAACSSRDFSTAAQDCDLVIYRVPTSRVDHVAEFEENMRQAGQGSALLLVEEDALKLLRMPSHVNADFALTTACDDELAVRLRHLLWPGEETSSADFITVGPMTLNLSTYQVQVDGQPLDFTYLEYALLAFLVTHPGHAYSRDALLRRVWGFEYYGGSRTVDVHVRRVRAKLGTELAAHLETVRGVGYMWNN